MAKTEAEPLRNDDRREVVNALVKERKAISELILQAGERCSETSEGCACHMAFTYLAQVVLARK